MTHERAEQLLSSCERPVRRVPLQERLQGQRAEKPPEDAVGEAPAQTRSVPADVALKKQSERRSDDHSDDKVQRLSKSGRGGSNKAAVKGKKCAFANPCPKDEQVTNQFGKVRAGGVQHSHSSVRCNSREHACGSGQPEQERKGQSPKQTSAGRRGP